MAERQAGQKILFVLGMHRSGTSAVTRVLSFLGGSLPRDLERPNKFNERGYWESHSVMQFNDALLSEVGSKWDDWGRVDDERLAASAGEGLGQSASDLLDETFEDAPLVLLKDPRICRLFSFWCPVAESKYDSLFAVIPVRRALEVAGSLKEREGFPMHKGLFLWLRHVLESERVTRGLPRSIFSLDDFVSDPRKVSDKIAQDLSLDWTTSFDAADGQVSEFISRDLLHQRVDATASSGSVEIDKVVSPVYEAMLALAKDENDERARAQLDEQFARLNHLSDVVGKMVLETEAQAATIRSKADEDKASLAETRSTLVETRAALAESQSEVGAAQSFAAQLETKLEEANHHLQQLNDYAWTRLGLSVDRCLRVPREVVSKLQARR